LPNQKEKQLESRCQRDLTRKEELLIIESGLLRRSAGSRLTGRIADNCAMLAITYSSKSASMKKFADRRPISGPFQATKGQKFCFFADFCKPQV
jgi:hypothetical protein